VEPQAPIFATSLAADIRSAIGQAMPATIIVDEEFWRTWVSEWMRDRGLVLVGEAAAGPTAGLDLIEVAKAVIETASGDYNGRYMMVPLYEPDGTKRAEWTRLVALAARSAAAPSEPEHDINCGIDPLHLGEDIGCTCHVRFESAAAPSVELDDLIEKARDWHYSDEWIGNAFRARLTAATSREAR
jgi:hypothetical protein